MDKLGLLLTHQKLLIMCTNKHNILRIKKSFIYIVFLPWNQHKNNGYWTLAAILSKYPNTSFLWTGCIIEMTTKKYFLFPNFFFFSFFSHSSSCCSTPHGQASQFGSLKKNQITYMYSNLYELIGFFSKVQYSLSQTNVGSRKSKKNLLEYFYLIHVSPRPISPNGIHMQAMYTERGGGFLNAMAREEGRVALAGVGLVFLHTAGRSAHRTMARGGSSSSGWGGTGLPSYSR
jgi:hypothetical protein